MGPAPPLSLLIKYCIILNVLYPALLLFHTEVSQKSLKSLFCGHFKSDLKNKEGSGLLCATQELRCCLILAFKKLNIITVNLARSVFKTLCFSKVRQKQSEGVRSDGPGPEHVAWFGLFAFLYFFTWSLCPNYSCAQTQRRWVVQTVTLISSYYSPSLLILSDYHECCD